MSSTGLAVLDAADKIPGKSNGINYPLNWKNWSIIAVSHRKENNTLRVILGNKIAVHAARLEEVNPWPDGTILAKVVWKDTQLKEWKNATVPGKFVHVEFMFKDSKRFKKTRGWGWARWIGIDLKPYNKGARACIACHYRVKKRDWVFTKPAILPK